MPALLPRRTVMHRSGQSLRLPDSALPLSVPSPSYPGTHHCGYAPPCRRSAPMCRSRWRCGHGPDPCWYRSASWYRPVPPPFQSMRPCADAERFLNRRRAAFAPSFRLIQWANCKLTRRSQNNIRPCGYAALPLCHSKPRHAYDLHQHCTPEPSL